jgi:hypothetical protein
MRCRSAGTKLFYLVKYSNEAESLMRKLTMTLMAAAFALGAMALQANALNLNRGAICTYNSLKNATPIVTHVACNGWTGACGCGPGFISACRDRCCRCVPC